MTSPSTDRRLGLSGGQAIKVPVACATTANITLTAEQTIDGVTTSESRVLVWNQTDTTENGIYTSDSGAWTRAYDFDGTYDAVKGTLIMVAGGSTYANTLFRVTSTDPLVIGTSAITFTFSGLGDASNINYTAPGTGAVTRTVAARLGDITFLSDFNFKTTNTAAQNKTALDNAIAVMNSNRGGELRVARGSFPLAPGSVLGSDALAYNVTLIGAGGAMGYQTPNEAGTVFVFTAGAIGLNLTSFTSAGNYASLREICLDGNSLVTTGVKIAGMALLRDMDVLRSVSQNIWLNGAINNTSLDHVSASYCSAGYGLLVSEGSGTGNTIWKADHLVLRQNNTGARVEQCQYALMQNITIEGNTTQALVLRRVAGGTLEHFTLMHAFLEDNGIATSGYAIEVSTDDATPVATDGPTYFDFWKVKITQSGATARHLDVQCGYYGNFYKCEFIGGDQPNSIHFGVGANLSVQNVEIYDKNGGTITRDAGVATTTTANIYTAGNSGYPGVDAKWYAQQYQYPAVDVPSTDVNCNDMYRETSTGGTVITLTGISSAVTGTAFYTINGNVVTMSLPTMIATLGTTATRTYTGLTTDIIPNTPKKFPCVVSDNGGILTQATMTVSTANPAVINIYPTVVGSTTPWTSTGTCRIEATSLTYTKQ